MNNGLKNLQAAARSAARRERLESGNPLHGYNDDSGISGLELAPDDEALGDWIGNQGSPETETLQAPQVHEARAGVFTGENEPPRVGAASPPKLKGPMHDEAASLSHENTDSSEYFSGSELDCESALGSPDEDIIQEGHPFYRSVPKIVEAALAEFDAWRRCRGGGRSGGSRPPKDNNQCQGSSRSTKRRRTDGDQDSEEANEDESSPSKRRKISTEKEDPNATGLSLACPYYKRDRFRHSKCLFFDLTKISYVKQHLRRHHMQPHYCPLCGQSFNKLEDQRAHIRLLQCARRDFEEPDGINEDQSKKLESRVNRKWSLEQQWFSIWDIVFPGVERPQSPYTEGPIHEILSSLRQFLRERGPEIVVENLRSREELPYDIANEERDLDALLRTTEYRLMNRLIDDFSDSYSNDSNGSQGNVSSNPERLDPLPINISSEHSAPTVSQPGLLEQPSNTMAADTTIAVSGLEIETPMLSFTGFDRALSMTSHESTQRPDPPGSGQPSQHLDPRLLQFDQPEQALDLR